MPQTRYLANDGQAIVVRPTGDPAGTRVYEMKWDSVNKSIKVYNPLDGSFITDLPGRWTGRKEIGQAVRRCVKSFLEIERDLENAKLIFGLSEKNMRMIKWTNRSSNGTSIETNL